MVGYKAGEAINEGISNVCIGHLAGDNITTVITMLY